ncbi:MAG TPA: hypothetical protein VGI48_06305 [Caldimonas sp.]|jgi:hypothetical protein
MSISISIAMSMTKIALYRASLLADNLGIRLCLAALMVMPSAFVFLLPILALLGAPNDVLWPTGLVRDGAAWATLSFALAIGFGGAWMRIVLAGRILLRRPGLRLFVLGALGLGVAALAIDLLVLLASSAQDGAGWLLSAALLVSSFLLAGTLGQPRPERLHRV